MGKRDMVNCERKGRGQQIDAELHGQEEHNNNMALNKERGRLLGYNMIISERWIALMIFIKFLSFPISNYEGMWHSGITVALHAARLGYNPLLSIQHSIGHVFDSRWVLNLAPIAQW